MDGGLSLSVVVGHELDGEIRSDGCADEQNQYMVFDARITELRGGK